MTALESKQIREIEATLIHTNMDITAVLHYEADEKAKTVLDRWGYKPTEDPMTWKKSILS